MKCEPIDMIFYGAVNTDLVLGATDKTYAITRKGMKTADQNKAFKLTYICPKKWLVHMSNDTIPLYSKRKDRKVRNTETCELLHNATAAAKKDEKILRNLFDEKKFAESK